MGELLLSLSDVTGGYGEVTVLRNLNMGLSAGEVVSVIGPNGAGKSSVLKVIINQLGFRTGTIRLIGEEITELPAHRIMRRGIAYVPQGRVTFPNMTVAENLDVALEALGRSRADRDRMLARCAQLFPKVMARYRQLAGTMSGGEQQMVALARALMTEPKVILLDEPSLGLSPKLMDNLFDKLLELRSHGMAILLVEQNATAALEISDRGYVLDLGEVRFTGPAPDLLRSQEVLELYLGA